jgi:hypothetical protein
MTHPVLADNSSNGKSAATGRSSATAPLVLSRPLGRTTWLGRVDGTPVTARLMVAPVSSPALLIPEPDQNLPSNLISFLGTYVVDGTGWAVSEFVPGTSLDRLLGMAILTPAQATYVAAGIFAGLADLHAHGRIHGDLSARHVVIGNDGRPRLAGWALGPSEHYPNVDAARIADLDAARAVVFELARNCDRPVGRHSPGGSKLLVDLERLGTGAVLADAQATAEHLTDRLDSVEGIQTGDSLMRAELASLVRAGARSADVGRERTAPIPKPQPAREAKPVPPVPDAPLSKGNWLRRRKRRVLWAALILVVALAAAGFVAHKSISRFADRVLNGNSSSSSTPPGHGKNAKHATNRNHHSTKAQAGNGAHAHGVPVLAPHQAGLVRKVGLQRTGTCRLHGPCPVQVTVTVKPTSQARSIAWRVVSVNRCTGKRHVAARGTMTVSANSSAAWDTPRLNLRGRHGVAAIAVTSTPAHAASRPLLVPAHHISC